MPAEDRWRERLGAWVAEAQDWCHGRNPWVRLPLLLWMAWIGVQHLGNADYQSWFKPLTLGLHEAGHLLLGWFGSAFLTMAGGTLVQLAAPVATAAMFRRQPDWFGISVAGAWLADSAYDVALYMADAREMDLPLVTVGDGECFDVCHDWHFLLRETGLLGWDTTLAGGLRLAAFVVLWVSVAFGAWLLWRMARLRSD